MSSSFCSLLVPRLFALQSAVGTSESVISALADLLQREGYVAPSYKQAVIAREKDLPTGLPLAEDFAVAVPHTDACHVLKPGIAVATLPAPVSFRNMEDPEEKLPVRAVFALALNDKDAQIEMLQAVCSLLQAPQLLRDLVKVSSPDAAMDILRQADVVS